MNSPALRHLSAIAVLLIGLTVSAVAADSQHLEVRRLCELKASPTVGSATVRHVARGSHLELLSGGQQTDGYYRVRVPEHGDLGWIHRSFVRIRPGPSPSVQPDAAVATPLADSTLHLTEAQREFAIRHLRVGKPQALFERVREGYALAQDARLKIPVWVQYELTREMLRGTATREDTFRPDTSIPRVARAELRDYARSGFDRGHMAPAADMKRSEEVMHESFLLSNIAPQVGIGFNRNIWAQLEDVVRGWVEQRGALTIITGPAFVPDGNTVSYSVIGPNAVAVPTHFYKIIVDSSDSTSVQAIAFLMPNASLTGRDLQEFLVSISRIEALTGLNFLSSLPESVQAAIESQPADGLW